MVDIIVEYSLPTTLSNNRQIQLHITLLHERLQFLSIFNLENPSDAPHEGENVQFVEMAHRESCCCCVIWVREETVQYRDRLQGEEQFSYIDQSEISIFYQASIYHYLLILEKYFQHHKDALNSLILCSFWPNLHLPRHFPTPPIYNDPPPPIFDFFKIFQPLLSQSPRQLLFGDVPV